MPDHYPLREWDPWVTRDIKPATGAVQKVDVPGFGVEVVSGAAVDYFITFDEPPGSAFDFLNGERLYDGLFLPRAFTRFWILFPGAVQSETLVLRIHQTPNLAVVRASLAGSDFQSEKMITAPLAAVVGAGVTVALCGNGSAIGDVDQALVFGAGIGRRYRSTMNFLSGVMVSTGAFRMDLVAYPSVSLALTPEPIAQRLSVAGVAYPQSANLENGWTIFGGGGLVGPCPLPACMWQLQFTNTTGAPTTSSGVICSKSRY